MSAALAQTHSLTSIESRALELLSSGIEAVAVAGALGISESRISQLLAEPTFATKLAEARFEQLRKHNATDNEYDAVEKELIAILRKQIPMMAIAKPMEIARVLSIINSAKRRGASAPESITRTKPVVRLSIPIQVIQRFQVNAANQVVEVGTDEGSQELVTMQSGNVQRLLNEQAKPLQLPTPNRYNPAYRQDTRTEAEGKIWSKRLGREQNLLEELGFTVEIPIDTAQQ